MLPVVSELLELGFGPEAVVLEALKRRHGNRQMAVVDLMDLDGLTSPEERRTARLILDGYPRDLVERALEITQGNVCHARGWLARNHGSASRGATARTSAPDGGVEQPGSATLSADVSDAESEEVGPLTLEPIPAGEAVTILGDPTAQKYTRSVLADWLISRQDNAIVPMTGEYVRNLPEARKRPGESDAAWIERILVPAEENERDAMYQMYRSILDPTLADL